MAARTQAHHRAPHSDHSPADPGSLRGWATVLAGEASASLLLIAPLFLTTIPACMNARKGACAHRVSEKPALRVRPRAGQGLGRGGRSERRKAGRGREEQGNQARRGDSCLEHGSLPVWRLVLDRAIRDGPLPPRRVGRQAGFLPRAEGLTGSFPPSAGERKAGNRSRKTADGDPPAQLTVAQPAVGAPSPRTSSERPVP